MMEEKQAQQQALPTSEKRGRQPCEIYSRVVGYLRPISQWNDGKQAEFAERKTYDKQLKVE